MKTLSYLSLSIAMLLSFSGCEDSLEQELGRSNAPFSGKYAGVANTTIQYFDGFGQLLGTRTFQTNVALYIEAPASSGGITESNPFNFQLLPGNAAGEGEIEIRSAVGFTDPRDGREILFQYWRITTNGNQISGQLTDTHIAESVALNFVNAETSIAGVPIVWNYPMAVNTRFTGTVNGNTLTLRVEGNSTDMSRPFVSEITLQRN